MFVELELKIEGKLEKFELVDFYDNNLEAYNSYYLLKVKLNSLDDMEIILLRPNLNKYVELGQNEYEYNKSQIKSFITSKFYKVEE